LGPAPLRCPGVNDSGSDPFAMPRWCPAGNDPCDWRGASSAVEAIW
jgi:hypothetical protein